MYFQSTVCSKIMEQLGQTNVDRKQQKVAIISQDSFYKVLSDEEQELASKGLYNFDHPGKYSHCTIIRLRFSGNLEKKYFPE